MNDVFNALKRRRLETTVARRVASVVFLTFVATFFTSCRQNVEETQPVQTSSVASLENAVDKERANRTFKATFVGWSDADFALWRSTTDGTNFAPEAVKREAFASTDFSDCDVVLIRAIGWTPTDEERAKIDEIFARNVATIAFPSTLDAAREATNVSPELAAAFYEYLTFPCEENVRSASAFLAKNFGGSERTEIFYWEDVAEDGKKGKTTDGVASRLAFDVKSPKQAPPFGYFYWGPQIDETLEAFQARRDADGRDLPPNSPKIALFGPFLEPFKAEERGPQDELIGKLEARGFDVYPIYNLKNNKNLLLDVKPDLAIYFPRGRALPEGAAVDVFKSLNCPVLSAVCLSVSEAEYRSQPVGATGSYYALTTALPELDGVIEPTAIATKDADETGFVARRALSERVDALVERCAGWIELRRKSNADKRLAIFFYKAPGGNALTAQSLEVVPSLYNTLTRLRDEGFDLGADFPQTLDEFRLRIEREGRTIGQWNLGDFERFVEEARPEFVSENVYRKWFNENLTEDVRRRVVDVWGAAPGDYMTRDVGDEFGVLVPRLRFGNVALIPQPSTDVLEDAPYSKNDNDFDAVHGTDKAPPHFYWAAYFWALHGFAADALVHFGTHGSLEFTPGKSAFTTENCFPDALIGDKPHLYLYSVNNIGEAFLAKRRARATIISHLTPPFAQSDLYGDLKTVDAKLHEYLETTDSALKSETAAALVAAVLRSNLLDDLLDEPAFRAFADAAFRAEFERSGRVFDEAQVETLHKVLHRYEDASVTNGLHVVGRPWTDEQVAQTAAQTTLAKDDAEKRLRDSFELELNRFVDGLCGRFIPPSTGGDFLVNNDAAPTGRNLAGLDVQKLPTPEAERLAAKLTDDVLSAHREANGGAWPRRVACVLWGGESIRTRGVAIAQVFYLLGVRVKYDSRGNASELELIPSNELGRPRIDVLVQTSGQFRDAFGAKIEAIDRAVRLAAEADDDAFPNFVRENVAKITERLVRENGTQPEEAAELATARVFGSTNALSYGTGIMRLVERGDLWNDETEVAERYLANMSGVYRDASRWGTPVKGLLEYNLDGTELMLQSRSSNVWGPAKLDHVYEFATLATAVRAKTGNDPKIWFDDLRSPTKPRVETARAALREELRTTLWNPKYLKGLQREGAGAAASTAKTVRNLYGWNVAQPDTIDASVWEETTAVFVDDARDLGIREWFETQNPAALQDMTAVMLETVRKGYWDAAPETVEKIAKLHAELVAKHGASGSYETTGNKKLIEFIGTLPLGEAGDAYRAEIERATTPPQAPQIQGLALTEITENAEKTPESDATSTDAATERRRAFLVFAVLLGIVALGFAVGERASFTRR
ncbi:MAG: cobaltochelatase subunit CobN [Thermoguttaceae bacterium]|nr:cobaltochelatase subunit CobN [Thermoguttaceae bacterium]